MSFLNYRSYGNRYYENRDKQLNTASPFNFQGNRVYGPARKPKSYQDVYGNYPYMFQRQTVQSIPISTANRNPRRYTQGVQFATTTGRRMAARAMHTFAVGLATANTPQKMGAINSLLRAGILHAVAADENAWIDGRD